jgi:hypothetical protein
MLLAQHISLALLSSYQIIFKIRGQIHLWKIRSSLEKFSSRQLLNIVTLENTIFQLSREIY